ncbi:MAG: glycosyltransferase [Crocinitomicaceae bacterium]|nr:glycosyltransferase [Crocinitomicaceae bacterium]
MSKEKHILFMSSWYPHEGKPFLGNFVQRQAQLLSQAYQVTVVHTVSSEKHSECTLVTNSTGNLKEIIVYHPQGKSVLSKSKIQKKALKLALDQVSDVDALLTQVILPRGWQFLAVQKKYKCPWIHLEQGSYFRPEKREQWSVIEKVIVRKACKKISRLLAASEFVKKDLKKVFCNRAIDVIPNHVDTTLFQPSTKAHSSEKTKFLHISTLDENTKNPLGMLEACSLLKEKVGEVFEFLIISDEPTEKWQAYVVEYGLQNIVKFDGPKAWNELPQFYQQTDAFILNSIYETFSIVLAESWACGTPTITTPVGIGYNLPEQLGMNTTIGNSNSMANAMSNFIEKKDQFDRDHIRLQGENYSSEKILELLTTTINQHIG